MASKKHRDAEQAVRKRARDLPPEQQEQVIAAAVGLEQTIKQGKELVRVARQAAGC
jgi:hypothetical protein